MSINQNCNWIGHQAPYTLGGSTVELDNASALLGRLKARRDELKRLLAAQAHNRIELAKVERMIEAAEQPETAP